MTDNCPFCNIHERVLKSNDLAFLLMSSPKRTTGHLLAIPRRHIEEPWQQTKEEVSAIFELLLDAEQRLLPTFGEGCDIRQNYRPFLPQSRTKVDHLHYHLIPRDNEDRIYQLSEKHDNDLWQDLTDEDISKISQLFS